MKPLLVHNVARGGDNVMISRAKSGRVLEINTYSVLQCGGKMDNV